MAVKAKTKRGVKQQIGLLAYFFPSWFASGFDMEALLPIEHVYNRLEDLSRVRVSQPTSVAEQFWMSLLSQTRLGDWPATVSRAPIAVTFDGQDADTYRYSVDLYDDLFRIRVRGYLKRWEQDSTLITGKIQFDLHYASILLKSLFWLAGVVVAGGLALLALPYRLNIGWMIYDLLRLESLPALLVLVWLAVLAAVWINDVVAPANAKRHRLITRIEDTLLLPGLIEH